ncbi:Retrovirus-related Pol polyprotein from transposon 17.6 [Gossypium australe]|uniref:Retrovirus-related Pol polyprotein from transposon 17.6 n=1 Tax=Gossypium australe TaxID=47621 RepID=A0A5B6X3F4_9ROSI|nr:Retrovirus-related Pol polyprotein from transposon 17.6 [Gossypium australe]
MTQLLQKDERFEWFDKCQQSFDEIKALLAEASILVQPESGKEFSIYSDASLNGKQSNSLYFQIAKTFKLYDVVKRFESETEWIARAIERL